MGFVFITMQEFNFFILKMVDILKIAEALVK